MPAISEATIEVVEEGLLIEWSLLHSGGLEILSSEVSLRQDSASPFQLVPGGNLSPTVNNFLIVAGHLIQAGRSYQAAVVVSNRLGQSNLTATEQRESPVGMSIIIIFVFAMYISIR